MIIFFPLINCAWGSQAECDELAQRAEVLKEENATLRAEVSRIRSDYEQLLAQNASLKVYNSNTFFVLPINLALAPNQELKTCLINI